MKLFDEIPFLENEHITLKKIEDEDAGALEKMTRSDRVYRYLPTFLFEQKYVDKQYVIRQLYEDCFQRKEAIFLGIYPRTDGAFCGILELYGFKDYIHKISIGYRLSEEYWGRGIATEAVALAVDYLYSGTDIQIITASSMIENQGSANVLRKNDFTLVNSGVEEAWGFPEPVLVDKWIR